jgi:hypothetical protein
MQAIATTATVLEALETSVQMEAPRLLHQEPVRNEILHQPRLSRALPMAQVRAPAVGLGGYVAGRGGAAVAHL